MYMIVAYDVGVERVNKVKSFLRMYLTWIQNSLFEGEIRESQYLKIKMGLKDLIDFEHDAVVFYLLPTNKAIKRETIGVEKGHPDLNVF